MKALHTLKTTAFACSTKPPRINVAVRAAHTSVIRELQHDLHQKHRSAEEIAKHYIDTINQTNPTLGSFVTIDAERAIDQARAVDKRLASEGASSLGPLAGVPIAIKDNICTMGITTTAGSRILEGYNPPYNATAVDKLAASGAICIGKTNMDEFGMGSSTENSAYMPTRNPWDTSRVPGGSSGGSAAAVAASQCVAALGSDTGGSIRQPAHFCGVVGLKPTYGRVSRHGLVAYASSLDVIGPMARTVEDAAILLSIVAGADSNDATSSTQPTVDYAAGLQPASALSSQPLQGVKIGLVMQTMGEGVDESVSSSVRQALSHLESLGAVVEEVSLPTYDFALPAYYVLACSEASSNLSRYDGVRFGQRQAAEELRSMYNTTRGQGFGAEVKRRILMGTYALSAGYIDAYYKRAQQVRTLLQDEMSSTLDHYDLLVTPTAPTPAYKLGEKTSDPLAMYKGDLMTVSLNMAGLPGIVVPCACVDYEGSKLPVGVQFIGKAFGEQSMIRVAHIFEQTLGLTATPSLVLA